MSKPELVLAGSRAEPIETDPKEHLELGQWYWVRDKEGDTLACVTHIGSNYAELTSPHRTSWRIHFKKWAERIREQELRPEALIDQKVQYHRHVVTGLMDEIKLLTAHLGLAPIAALPDGRPQENALAVVHGTADVKAHKEALIKAEKETLPELFKKIEREHEEMATWMKAKLLPMQAEVEEIKAHTETIGDKIFVVELYAGLIEELALIHDGEPASNDEKVHLFQRLHFMDEECLVDYEAGGMEFDDIGEFDKWLIRNGRRLLPLPKCVVAFRVRRNEKHRYAYSLSDFIRVSNMKKEDESTFLYIRNGDRFYRLTTGINFGEELFPDAEHSLLRNHQLYVGRWGDDIIDAKGYADVKQRVKEAKARHKKELREWEKLGEEERKKKGKPYFYCSDSLDKWTPVSPETVCYDDAMAKIAAETKQFNRIAVVLQGLLDRSPAFHPHPPWKLWTPEGFFAGVELHYDKSRAVTSGDPPDFEAYRARVNASIKAGAHTVGQEDAWLRHEAAKENARRASDWRLRSYERHECDRFHPYGDPGPGLIAAVVSMSRDKGSCDFQWERERRSYRTKWVPNPDRPGYLMPDRSPIAASFRCKVGALLNVDAYEPGDYKQFYADPRTRADYLQWAPLLLAAEDFKAKK